MSHRTTDLLVVLLLLAGSVEASLRINEIVASNRSGLADEDGELSDWIEIYNEGPDAIDLAGWTLTDNIAEPNKWAFPSLIVAPAAYVVIFASGKDRADPLHTNFRL
ncbi:MAG: lamin tail domain-containing protein, partial [Verrucomicrobiales bacterium]|nr:lamin tail domain-containing protein [Verrucomicrobiales bacterium]